MHLELPLEIPFEIPTEIPVEVSLETYLEIPPEILPEISIQILVEMHHRSKTSPPKLLIKLQLGHIGIIMRSFRYWHLGEPGVCTGKGRIF